MSFVLTTNTNRGIGARKLKIQKNGVDIATFSANELEVDDDLPVTANIVVPTNLSDLSDDATHRLVSDTEKASWNAKSDFSGSYNDLTDNPTLGTAAAKDVPSSGNASTSQVVMGNDSRLSDSRPASDVSAWAKASTKPSYTASEVGAIASSLKGAASGVAELDSNGKVPSAQLPSYVDDVLEYNSLSNFPTTGETGKIYVAKDTNKTYRWSGTAYVEISPSLALGETSSTAYRGDRGKTAYDHSQTTSGNPHNVTKSDVGLGNVGNFKAVSTVASQGLTDTEKSNARANIGAGTSSLTLGSTASTAAAGNHTHSTSIAADSGTNQLTLAANTKYKLTAGGTGFVFTTPPDTNTWRGIQDNLTSDSTTESLSAKQGKNLANGSARDSTKLPLAGGTMTGQILTSFKSSVAMGSYQATSTTIADLCNELRYSSGCCGSFSLSTAYTKDNITISTGWYNFLWIPHRSGGVNGAASGDNCNYGSFIISGMTVSGCYLIRYTSGGITELRNLYADTNTTYAAGTGVTISGTNNAINVTYGTAANTACQGNDSRLSNARTPTSHTHGNIQNGGTLQTNDVTIASGDKLVITDSSDSSKVARASIAFDGSTATKCLTQKGTWESFAAASHTHSADNIVGGYLNIQPENGPTLIPFMNNDIAFLTKRGGTATISYNGTAQSIDLANCFDGTPGYGYSIGNSGDYTSIIIELTLHKSFGWGNTFYIDFGSASWRATSIKVEAMNTNYSGDTWTQKYNNTSNGLGHIYFGLSHTPVGASNAGAGFNKIRITFTAFANAGFRIAQMGLYNYSSAGLSETYLSKGGGTLYGNIMPYTTNGASVGDANHYWNYGYITNLNSTTLNGISIGSSPKFTDTNNRKAFFGTCSTASATAAKEVTLADTTGWELRAGVIVGVKFTNSNSATNPTINVNSSGAKSIWYRNAVLTGYTQYVSGKGNEIIWYQYDGTYWVYLTNQYNIPRIFVGASNTGSANAATTNGNTYLNLFVSDNAFDRHKITGTQGINVTSDSSGTISIGEHYVDVTNTLSTTADTTYTFTDSRITTSSAIDVYASIFGVNPKSVSVASGSCTVVFPKYSSAASMTARIYIK